VGIRLAVSQTGQDEELQRLGPVGGSLDVCCRRACQREDGARDKPFELTLERLLLELQLLLSRTGSWHVTGIHGHPRPLPRWRTVVMRCPGIPNDEITRSSLDLDPFEPLALEPLDAGLGEPVPLVGPLPNTGLLGKLLVELFTQEVSSLGHDQSAVIGTVGQEVDESLQASETRSIGVLVLMRPGSVGLEIFTAGKNRGGGLV